MPLVTICALPPPEPSRIDTMLGAVVRAVASTLERRPEDVWARFEAVTHAHSGDGRERWDAQHPIVTVTTRKQPHDVVERTLRAVTDAVAAGFGIEQEAVWGRWVTLVDDTVFSNGKLT